jgi:hypothetical protein
MLLYGWRISTLWRCSMTSIIALLKGEDHLARSIQRLKEAGFSEDRISVLNQENAIRRLLGCDPTCIVSRYAAFGAFIGTIVYALPALLAGLCQCNLFHYGQVYGIGAFAGGILAGAFIGGGLGIFIGAAEFEKGSHLYVQGTRLGGSVIVIQAYETEAENAMFILESEKASGVKAL